MAWEWEHLKLIVIFRWTILLIVWFQIVFCETFQYFETNAQLNVSLPPPPNVLCNITF